MFLMETLLDADICAELEILDIIFMFLTKIRIVGALNEEAAQVGADLADRVIAITI